MASKSSTEAPAAPGRSLPETVVVGRVRRAHGVQGEVAVEVMSDVPGRFEAGSELVAVGPSGRRSALTLVAARPHRGGLLARFAGVDDRDAADALRGARLEVARSAVPAAPAGTYYYFELVGCRCTDATVGELGEVTGLTEDGGGVLLVVEGPLGAVPIPFVQRFLRKVDVEAGLIELDLPPGLVETCASRS